MTATTSGSLGEEGKRPRRRLGMWRWTLSSSGVRRNGESPLAPRPSSPHGRRDHRHPRAVVPAGRRRTSPLAASSRATTRAPGGRPVGSVVNRRATPGPAARRSMRGCGRRRGSTRRVELRRGAREGAVSPPSSHDAVGEGGSAAPQSPGRHYLSAALAAGRAAESRLSPAGLITC